MTFDPRAPADRLRTYGRVKARPLSDRQQRLVDELLPRIAVPAGEGTLDLAALFPGAADIRLEIGFGAGEHLAAQAARAPHAGFIGAEPFLDGVAKALGLIDDAGLANVRIHAGDAREVLDRLPDASLSTIYILFPDPWPKTRHWKRRFIQTETAAALARVLRPGGRLVFATDWKAYAAWALERLRAEPRLVWTATRAADWRTPPQGHVATRYEEKRLGDTTPVFLEFERA